jgi:hypothetical protein
MADAPRDGLIDPQALAQLREVTPAKETVITWTRFRCMVGKLKLPDGTEEFVLEFRSMDGAEVHQWVLDEDTRSMVVDALSQKSRLVTP